MAQKLPVGWNWVKVDDVADTKSGGTPSRSHPEYFDGDIPWIKSGELKDCYIRNADEYITDLGLKKSSANVFSKGTIVVALYGATAGKVGILDFDTATNQAVCAIIPKNESFIPKYMFYWIISQRDNLLNQRIGGAQPNISQGIIRSQLFPLTSLENQISIVEKIEELFSQLDAGVAGLNRAQAALQRYRASVLKAAFEGRLVPQDPNDEPIVNSYNIESKKVLDKEKYQTIPDKWECLQLVNCVDVLDRKRIPVNSKEREKRISGKDESELYPYYGATGQVGWIDDYIFDDELVLLGEDGAPFIDIDKEKAYIVKGKFWVNNHAHVIRAKEKITTNRYILHFLNFFNYRDFVTGTTRLKLNQTKMKQIPIIIPPLNEQERIVEEIDRRLSIVNEIEKSIKSGFIKSDYLRNTILKSAFEGQLINTDTNIFIDAEDTVKQGNLFND